MINLEHFCPGRVRPFLALLLIGLSLSACEVTRRDAPVVASEHATEDAAPTATDGDPAERIEPDPNDQRSLEQKLRDASVAAQVKLALADEDQLRRFNFEPDVRGGIVTLQGEVSSANLARLAENVAARVEGVRTVRNALEAPGLEAELAAAEPDSEVTSNRGGQPDVASSEPANRSGAAATETDAEAAPSASTPDEAPDSYHTVASGESLWEIARQHDTSVDALKRLNDMQGDRLRPGQRLRVR